MTENNNLERVHQADLKILREVDRICWKYQIRYMLDSGTLLGAIRHHGFIPWDDDADLSFTRDQYEAFAKVAKKELPAGMKLLEPDQMRGGEAFFDFVPRILYLDSQTHEDGPEMQFYEGKLNHLYVDLFIQDDLPDSPFGQTLVKGLNTLVYGLAMGHRYQVDLSRYQGLSRPVVQILAGLGSHLPMRLIRRLQGSVSRMANGRGYHHRFYSNYAPDYYYMTIEKGWNAETVPVDFEGETFQAPKNWDRILTLTYGDYMTPPPSEKQVPTHSSMEIRVTRL